MKKQDYFLRCLLVESLADIGTHFTDKKTGKSEDKITITMLLKDEKIKYRFYQALENELQKVLKDVYGIHKIEHHSES